MAYLDWLKLLLALGPKLPEVFASVQRLIAEFRVLLGLIRPHASPEPGHLELVSVTPDEAELEAQVAAALVPEGTLAAFDGTLLRRVYTFLREHPELAAVLVTLLKHALGG